MGELPQHPVEVRRLFAHELECDSYVKVKLPEGSSEPWCAAVVTQPPDAAHVPDGHVRALLSQSGRLVTVPTGIKADRVRYLNKEECTKCRRPCGYLRASSSVP